jgi:hypothetical protein
MVRQNSKIGMPQQPQSRKPESKQENRSPSEPSPRATTDLPALHFSSNETQKKAEICSSHTCASWMTEA